MSHRYEKYGFEFEWQLQSKVFRFHDNNTNCKSQMSVFLNVDLILIPEEN